MTSSAADEENIDPAKMLSAEKQAPGTPSRAEMEAAAADTPTTPPPEMTAEEADAETPVMSAEAADAETPEPATPEPATTTTPATLDALHNYLGPLCQALLGATPEALAKADASNVAWFAGQPAGSTLVCTTDDDGNVTYHRGRARRGASRYIIIASTAPLGPTISEGGLAADALSIDADTPQVLDQHPFSVTGAEFRQHNDLIYSLEVAVSLTVSGGGNGLLLVRDLRYPPLPAAAGCAAAVAAACCVTACFKC